MSQREDLASQLEAHPNATRVDYSCRYLYQYFTVGGLSCPTTPSPSRNLLLTLPTVFPCPGPWREEEKQGHFFPDSADRGPSPQTFSAVSERLRRLSDRSEEALSKLPNDGRPTVGKDGMVREYRGVDTSRLPDPGHRHFSGLWALYPGFQVRRRACVRCECRYRTCEV